MKRFAKLVMVTGENNNKYYQMEWDGKSPNFNVEYGRIESTKTVLSYPISQWDKKYGEKVNKGYKDLTESFAEVKDDTKSDKLDAIKDAAVDRFLTLMKKYTDGLVSKTYSVKANQVTKKQIENAQGFIDKLTKVDKKKIKEVNALLLELYMEIPRYMSKVQDYLLPNINLDKTIEQEQDNLDAMASQVSMVAPKKTTKAKKNLLDILGVTMVETDSTKDIDYIVKQLPKSKIQNIFKVKKQEHDDIFDKWMARQTNKSTRHLIHGTRCTSVVPIIEQGLKIRPMGNYQFSGKAYGDGNYFSEITQKSLGYTGYDSDQVLIIYEVHTGNPFKYNGWYTGNSFSLTYDNLQKRGFDSTHVSAGNGLANSEIIAYKEEQARIKYIIWLKR